MHATIYTLVLLLLLLGSDSFVLKQTCNSRLLRLAADAGTADAPATPSGIKAVLQQDMKTAMKAKDKERLAGIRAIQTAIKQREVDDRVEVDDSEAINIMAKLVKQRRESIKSYQDAGRTELVEAEEQELNVIQSYMPAQLSPEEVEKIIDETISRLGATSIKDMGKVMNELKTTLAGKADASEIGASLKKKLSPPK